MTYNPFSDERLCCALVMVGDVECVCLRGAYHPGRHEPVAKKAGLLDGVHWCCRAPISGDHEEWCCVG